MTEIERHLTEEEQLLVEGLPKQLLEIIVRLRVLEDAAWSQGAHEEADGATNSADACRDDAMEFAAVSEALMQDLRSRRGKLGKRQVVK